MPRRGLAVALFAGLLFAPAASAHGGATADPERWWAAWNASPWQAAPVGIALVLYVVRARKLGSRLPAWRAVCFLLGLAVAFLAIVSPIDTIGEEALFSMHMLQHILLGDLAPLLMVLGATGPILRPVLALRWVQRLQILMHPVVALAIWVVLFLGWHLPVLYEAAIRNDLVHVLEHISFFTAGALMWGSLIETLPQPEWFSTGMKLGYVGAVRIVQTILGNIIWWSGAVLYPIYSDNAAAWGTTAIQDQALAGTIMMSYTGLVTLGVITILFFRMARESELRQRLIEAGVDQQAARRAVRFGRAEELASRHGVELPEAHLRAPGIS